jgi:hypothetical protein
MPVAKRSIACSLLLPVVAAGLARAALASPEEVAAMLTAPGAWAYVDEGGEVRPSGSFTGVPPESALTEAGLEQRASFDFRTDDPVLGCDAPGMPRALTAASPMTFSFDQDRLVIRYESMDVARDVFMNTDAVPANTPRTPNGFARAHWEPDDTLVIRTSNLDGRIQDLLGTPKSEAMTLEERYRVERIDGETRMHLDLIMTDPVYMVEPYTWTFEFVLKPDWGLLEYGCVERPVELTPGVVPEPVDSKTDAESAESMLATIADIDRSNVRFLVNTHEHPGQRGGPPAPDIALPGMTIATGEGMTLHLNGETVEILDMPAAHTASNSMVRFVNANVYHLGDLYTRTRYPVIAGGTVQGFIEAADEVLTMSDAESEFIPGVGEVGDRADLERYRNMLVTVRDRVAGLIEQGESLDDILAANTTAEFDATYGDPSRLFMPPMFQELSGD